MTALAAAHGIDRADTARWTLCFAAVLAAHALAAVWLLPSPEASEFDAGAPVVLLELPEAPASLATPPNDLAPGPPEAESEPTPPKEEETKPPEQEAEVSLPVPEPPKPPQEERAPTAQPSVAMPSVPAPPTPGAEVAPSTVVVKRWESTLVAHIERFKRYPAEARAHGEQGTAQVAFTIDRDGWVRASRIVRSSGSPELDAETLAMLNRAQPMPPPPPRLASRELSFVVPVRFNIK
jgi:periplasmic protein TonB